MMKLIHIHSHFDFAFTLHFALSYFLLSLFSFLSVSGVNGNWYMYMIYTFTFTHTHTYSCQMSVSVLSKFSLRPSVVNVYMRIFNALFFLFRAFLVRTTKTKSTIQKTDTKHIPNTHTHTHTHTHTSNRYTWKNYKKSRKNKMRVKAISNPTKGPVMMMMMMQERCMIG